MQVSRRCGDVGTAHAALHDVDVLAPAHEARGIAIATRPEGWSLVMGHDGPASDFFLRPRGSAWAARRQVPVSVLRAKDVADMARSTPEVRAGRVDQHIGDELDAYGVR